MRWILSLTIAALSLLILVSPARADVLVLTDGRIIERAEMERVEGGVKVIFENGDVVVPDDLIQDTLLTGKSAWEPTTDKEREKAEKGLVPFEGKWVKKSKLPDLMAKRIAERRAEIAKIKDGRLWRNRWKEKTKHFEFEYTVPPHVFEPYRDLMEAYYSEFAKTWRVKQPKDYGRLKVCFYTDIKKFHQIGGVGGGVQGYFRFVKPLELDFFYERLDPRHTEQVMYHEANHYLQLLMNPGNSMPHFPGEAIAEYYGASEYDPATKTLSTGLVLEGRLTEIKNDIAAGEMLGLEKMVSTDQMYQHYTWGWSLAHYLMNDAKYRKKFEKFVKELAYGKNVTRVSANPGMTTIRGAEVWAQFQKFMGLKDQEDVDAMEQAWHAYVKDELKLTSSRGLEKAGQGALNTGRRLKAKRLFREAIEAGSESPLVYYRYADLLEDDRKFAEAIGHMRKAIELAPLEAEYYAALGRMMRMHGEQEEGKKMIRLALELDPDNPYLEDRVLDLLEDVAGE